MRHRIWSAALAAAALIMIAAPAARADNYPVRDGTGASQTFCSKLVGGLQYPCHLIYGMFGSTPTAVTMDGANLNVHVQVSDLPNGAATGAKQDAANASLSSIVTNTAAGATGSNQLLANGKLDIIITNTASASTAANQTAVQATAGSNASKATAVQGCTSCKSIATLSTPAPTASTTDRSITIATGGTAQQVMGSNTSRRSFYVFNPNATSTCWASFTTTTPAANGLGAFPLPSLGGFGMESNAATSALYVNCPTTGQFITAWESQ